MEIEVDLLPIVHDAERNPRELFYLMIDDKPVPHAQVKSRRGYRSRGCVLGIVQEQAGF